MLASQAGVLDTSDHARLDTFGSDFSICVRKVSSAPNPTQAPSQAQLSQGEGVGEGEGDDVREEEGEGEGEGEGEVEEKADSLAQSAATKKKDGEEEDGRTRAEDGEGEYGEGEGEGEGKGKRKGKGKRNRKGEGKRKREGKGEMQEKQERKRRQKTQNAKSTDSASDSSNDFEVDELLELKNFDQDDGTIKTAYLVKWQGFGVNQSTWETATQIARKFPNAVATFLAKGREDSAVTATANTADVRKTTEQQVLIGAGKQMISQMSVDEFRTAIVTTLDEACGYAVWPGNVIVCLLYQL